MCGGKVQNKADNLAQEPRSDFLLVSAPATEFTLLENRVYTAKYDEQQKRNVGKVLNSWRLQRLEWIFPAAVVL
jgi:hypothetical protein